MTSQATRIERNNLQDDPYSKENIQVFELIFGNSYVSPGGEDSARHFADLLGLREGQKVLDVACGCGGPAFLMARQYGVDVLGIDLSDEMICKANEYRENLAENIRIRVHFQVANAVTMEYPAEHYDVVHSRDAILHMHDKSTLFKKLYESLKPGGKLLITDYCRNSNGAITDAEFEEYVKNHNYDMISISQYELLLSNSGLANVVGVDISNKFSDILKKELEILAHDDNKRKMTDLIGSKDYEVWYNLWKDKIDRVEDGHHVWGLFTASKPIL